MSLISNRVAFYLSEMAVSDGHGGGLTVQRVLGGDLGRFDALISVGSFGRSRGPSANSSAASRQVDLPLDSLPERTNVLRRFKPWLRSRECVYRWEVAMAWRRLKRVLGDRPRLLVCPQWSLSVDLTTKAVDQLAAEYITWVMDDHPLKLSGAAMIYEPAYEKKWASHLRGARKMFVISEAMREFYLERFGVESEVLHGAVSLPSMRESISASVKNSGRALRLGYAGALGDWQRDCLELIAEALPRHEAELHVAGRVSPAWLQKPSVVFRGEMPPESVQLMFTGCDAVVLPVSFDPRLTAMSRLNIATKLSELCACGRPLLAVGPADAAMIRELFSRGAAICVTNPTPAAVAEGVEQLRDPAICARVVANAFRWVEQEINLEEMQRRWRPSGDWLFEEGRQT